MAGRDPLEEYRRKRDFSRTPEPSGDESATSLERPLFTIQKHDASRLHYDLRLEIDGVLVSWAVPKGPSLDPAEKRLAVMTEDHPLGYGRFEGTIPEGEYGGGTVLLWDFGWWEPDLVWAKEAGDKKDRLLADEGPAAAVKAGELKFVLHGEKLRGSWVLVQMKGRGDKNWLLIKHRDDHARAGSDIESEAPLSVATGRDLPQIAQDDTSTGEETA
jgi:bifunctional non-homologous end joining protein LigD